MTSKANNLSIFSQLHIHWAISVILEMMIDHMINLKSLIRAVNAEFPKLFKAQHCILEPSGHSALRKSVFQFHLLGEFLSLESQLH